MSITAIEQRLKRVEAAISTDGISASTPEKLSSLIGESGKKVESLVQRLEELDGEWKSLEDPTFRDFFEKYKGLSDLLNTDIELKELLISNTMKESILLSGFEDFESTAQKLDAVKSLQGVVDKTPIDNINEVQKRLSAMEAAMNVRADAVAKFHADVESFFDAYNKIINLMSQKFLLWDSAISSWEKK
mmetsp:Transcript_22588/g.31826  ORF Transcript_22588/g.31826 Transcript_22588/m.31826 type:complete len:189 (+) Transcript_22588:35-601(+)